MQNQQQHHLQYMREDDLERVRDILHRLNIEATPLDGGWYHLTMWLPDPDSERELYRRETIAAAYAEAEESEEHLHEH